MHLLCKIPTDRSLHSVLLRGERGGLSRAVKSPSSRRSRVAEELGERTSEKKRERERRRESKKGTDAPAGKRKIEREEPDGRTAGTRRNADAVSLIRSQAHPLTPSLGRLWMNSPTPGVSSPLGARAAAPRDRHRSYACAPALHENRVSKVYFRDRRNDVSIRNTRNRLRNILALKQLLLVLNNTYIVKLKYFERRVKKLLGNLYRINNWSN